MDFLYTQLHSFIVTAAAALLGQLAKKTKKLI